MKGDGPTEAANTGVPAVYDLSRDRLHDFLSSIGLESYAAIFAAQDIDFDAVSDLSERDLETLGVSLGHRKRLLKALAGRDAPSEIHRGEEPRARRIPEGTKPERRQLTVLFCDMVGSTVLSTRLDPEDLRDILHEFQARCSSSIRRFDGSIARFLGDGILAYFGFPRAHEDDAERAVNAALHIVASIKEMVGASPPIEVRIGIATGLVVVGDVIGDGPDQDFALVGEAPNLAARLQALALPNQILLAPQTRRLLGRLFELDDIGEHALKGFSQPVPVSRVVGPSSLQDRFEALRPAQMTPLVGRESELAALLQHVRRAERGEGHAVVITGEAGVGKSRLVAALRSRLAEQNLILSLQCSPFHTTSAWYPLIRLLEDQAGIVRDMPPEIRLERIDAMVERQADALTDSRASLLAALLSVESADRPPQLRLTSAQQKTRTVAAILDLLDFRARAQPVVMVVEDLHWIDPTTSEFLEHLRDRMRGWRFLLVLLSRPEVNVNWRPSASVSSLTIERLSPSDVAAMIDSMAGPGILSTALVNQIIARTDGVPLFVEEMTRAVLEAGQTATNALTVPASLHDSLMARLDQLAPVKAVAQAAAAIGRDFHLDLLQAVVSRPKAEIRAAIDRLLDIGLLHQDVAVDETYVFKHALVQEEAYDSMLREERRTLHLCIAEALSGPFQAIGEASPEVVAVHFARGGRPGSAIDFWRKAAQRASQRSAYIEAGTHLRSALGQLAQLPAAGERDELDLQLRQGLGSTLAASKGVGAVETIETFQSALELSMRMPDSAQTFSVINGMISVHVVRGEFERSQELAEDLLLRAQRQNDPTPKLMGHRGLGMSLFLIGELVPAHDQLRAALVLYDVERHGPLAFVFASDFKSTALAYLALTSVLLGDVEGGLNDGRDAVAHAERLGHPHSVCYALSFLSGALVLCREPERAAPIAEKVVALAREYEFPMWLAGGMMVEGWCRAELGDPRGGIAVIRASIDALEATTALIWVDFARYLLADALRKAGLPEQALAIVDEALLRIQSTRGRWYEAELHRLRGDLLSMLKAPAAAVEQCYRTAIAVATRQGALIWQLRAMTSLAPLLRGVGEFATLKTQLHSLCAQIDDNLKIRDLQEARQVLQLYS